MGLNSTDSSALRDRTIEFFSGSLGGVAATYAGQPLDTVKVKMQTFPKIYNSGMWHCLKQTLVKDGIRRGLYAGTTPAIVANVAENSVLFAAYGGCQKLMQHLTNAKRVEDLSVASNAMAGFLAAFFSSFPLCPTELIKCKMQAAREAQLLAGGKGVGINPLVMTRQIVHDDGVRGLFRGLSSTMFREMPGYFLFFGGYELTREILAPKGGRKEDVGALGTMLAGAAGGVFLWSGIFPFDVVKSRVQVQNINGNLFAIMYQIFRQEGILALYNGLGPTLLRTIPATAVLFVTVETTKKLLYSATNPEHTFSNYL